MTMANHRAIHNAKECARALTDALDNLPSLELRHRVPDDISRLIAAFVSYGKPSRTMRFVQDSTVVAPAVPHNEVTSNKVTSLVAEDENKNSWQVP